MPIYTGPFERVRLILESQSSGELDILSPCCYHVARERDLVRLFLLEYFTSCSFPCYSGATLPNSVKEALR